MNHSPEFLVDLNTYQLIPRMPSLSAEPQRVPQAAQRVSATFADLQQKLRVNTTQKAFLTKAEKSVSKRMHETRVYLGFVVDMAEKHLSQPSEERKPKVIVRLAEKTL